MNLATLLGLDSKMLDAVQEALPVFTKAFVDHTDAMRQHTKALNRYEARQQAISAGFLGEELESILKTWDEVNG